MSTTGYTSNDYFLNIIKDIDIEELFGTFNMKPNQNSLQLGSSKTIEIPKRSEPKKYVPKKISAKK